MGLRSRQSLGANWFHWMNSSNQGLTGQITGLDLINLPAENGAGSNVVSGLGGVKWKPSGHLEIAVGYEFPLTTNRVILQDACTRT
jgi:hypothetical protein